VASVLFLSFGLLLELAAFDPFVVPDDWVDDVPWLVVELRLALVACWFALVALFTVWLPLPTFTPGLTFAPTFRSELLTFALAFTSTFGLTLSERVASAPWVEPLVASLDDGVVDVVVSGTLLLDVLPLVVEPGVT